MKVDIVGTWPKDYVGRAFVEGAKWWMWKTQGCSPFSSEVDEMEAEALRRYPLVKEATVSEYRVEFGGGEWNVLTAGRPYMLQAKCPDAVRAERIARALAVLDAMEERDRQITEAMQGMAEDEPAVPTRGEGQP